MHISMAVLESENVFLFAILSLMTSVLLTMNIFFMLSMFLQAVADVAEQQVSQVFEAAQRDKEAAVSKTARLPLQTVQRRASKEALHQVQ